MLEFLDNLKRKLGAWLLGQDQGHAAPQGAPPVAERPADPTHAPPQSFADLTMRAIAQLVSVITNQFDYVLHQRMPPDGRVLASAEVAGENADGTLTVARLNTRIVTASGAIVGPHQLASTCGHPGCGQVEAVLLRCCICGGARCYLHCRELRVGGEPGIYCEEHLQQVLEAWDAWAERDLALGTSRPSFGTPPQPIAVKQIPIPSNDYGYTPPIRRRESGQSPQTR